MLIDNAFTENRNLTIPQFGAHWKGMTNEESREMIKYNKESKRKCWKA
jgi:hypothetical protein